MKHGLFTGVWDGTPKRESPVDKNNLPARCCAKCWHAVETQKPDRVVCCCPEHEDPDWDFFAYCDDCCDYFEPDTEEE